jgi:hypothetical protein
MRVFRLIELLGRKNGSIGNSLGVILSLSCVAKESSHWNRVALCSYKSKEHSPKEPFKEDEHVD